MYPYKEGANCRGEPNKYAFENRVGRQRQQRRLAVRCCGGRGEVRLTDAVCEEREGRANGGGRAHWTQLLLLALQRGAIRRAASKESNRGSETCTCNARKAHPTESYCNMYFVQVAVQYSKYMYAVYLDETEQYEYLVAKNARKCRRLGK